MATQTLYEISETLAALIETVDLCESEEERAECEAEILRTIEAQVRKVDDFCRFLAHLESQAELASDEMERLKERKNGFLRSAERLERYAIRVMTSLNVRRLEGQTARLTLRTSQPAVTIDDPGILPDQYVRVWHESSPDKRLIRAAIEAGEQVPGAHLAAPGVSLIRT